MNNNIMDILQELIEKANKLDRLKQRVKQNQLKYQKEHPEKTRTYKQKYYNNNKERVLEHNREYYERNKEAIKAQHKERYNNIKASKVVNIESS